MEGAADCGGSAADCGGGAADSGGDAAVAAVLRQKDVEERKLAVSCGILR